MLVASIRCTLPEQLIRWGLLPAILFSFIVFITGVRLTDADELDWQKLPPLPDEIGFAGCYAGVSNGVLLVAGGANFPDGPPWEGHAKVWHDRVFALTAPEGPWQLCATRMPTPAAYGVSFSVGEDVLLVGGGNAERHFNEVWHMRWTGEDVTFSRGPALPTSVAFMSGVRMGQRLYVLGGIERPTSTNALHQGWSMSLKAFPEKASGDWQEWRSQPWQDLPPWPGPGRMLPVVGTDAQQLYLISGVELQPDQAGNPRRVTPYLRDAMAYHPAKESWTELPQLPQPAAAAANAIFCEDALWIFGGDDGTRITEPPQTHTGFTSNVQRFDLKSERWSMFEAIPPGASRVTLPVAEWRGGWVLPSGEMKPGVRSPEVYWLRQSDD